MEENELDLNSIPVKEAPENVEPYLYKNYCRQDFLYADGDFLYANWAATPDYACQFMHYRRIRRSSVRRSRFVKHCDGTSIFEFTHGD
ncbi:hypothetical protein GCM10027347_59290 [Larkinella harenae]